MAQLDAIYDVLLVPNSNHTCVFLTPYLLYLLVKLFPISYH